MSRRDKLKGLFEDTAEELATANFEDQEEHREPAGPVRSMALTLGRMEDEARALHDAMVAGQHVLDLSPDLIDDSFVRDRIGEIELSEDDDFVRSIAENGQEVPILVRPHPEKAGRYQVAYGHRRLRAARVLGIAVKAVVREIADAQLVVAQGIENTARANLSYIERALFARALEDRGFSRPLIMSALTTDKTELSKLISVAKKLPSEVTTAIGRAPNIGRRKWIAFSDEMDHKRLKKLSALFASPSFASAHSDVRFEMALKLLQSKSKDVVSTSTWKPSTGESLFGTAKSDGKSYTLALKAADAAGFGVFLSEKLDELYQEFKQYKQESD